MPNRILKESICTSDTIDQLSWFEEVLFYRLVVNCDDYGRFDGRPAIIKNRLFPLKESLTLKAVSAAINTLSTVGLVILYEFEDRPYLQLATWTEHQNIRAKRSKYPAADESICKHMNTSASKCMQMYANVPVIQSNPIQSESNPNPNPNPNAQARSDRFDEFWKVYPKKVGKEAARRAFARVKAPVSTLIAAVEKQKQSTQWLKDNGQYIPNPATWLNQGRWEDETETDVRSAHFMASPDLDFVKQSLEKWRADE